MSAMQEKPTFPPPPAAEHCYRHPDEETRVHCTRCGRPICPKCMIPAPVGHQCPECVDEARREFRAGPGKALRWSGVSVTKAIMAVTVAAFVAEVAASGSNALMNGPDGLKMIQIGAEYAPNIAAKGEYWRLVTPMFLHFGIFHLALNMYALYLFGPLVEQSFGSRRMLLLYFITGVAGNVAEFVLASPHSVGAGASGAVFGLFGAVLAYGYRRRNTRIGRMQMQWVMQILLLNVFLTFVIPGIGYLAHLGGLVTGVGLAALLDVRELEPQDRWLRYAGVVVVVAALAILTLVHTSSVRDQLAPFVI
jgi:membrane associated rhomboid family serine protease